MTKIKLAYRKNTASSSNAQGLNSQFNGSNSSLNNNNGSSYVTNSGSTLIYRSLSGNTPSSTSNDEYIDSQFQKPPSRVPTRSICLATFLCFAGSSLLVLGMLVLSGNTDAKFADRVWPMIIMGFLMFIPGAYHVRIAYYAYKGKPGYSFDDIPEFE